VKILLTGATGFVGRRLVESLEGLPDRELTCAVRKSGAVNCTREALVHDLDADTDWSGAIGGQHVVIHAAARAHIMKDELADPLAEYRRVNVEGTLNLARQAIEAGVKRFIYISSIKVNGEQTSEGNPFTEDYKPAPEDPYGISKMEAEQALQSLATDIGMELVIIRPTLVYGPKAKGNFATMVKVVGKGLPLPLGAVHNKRSLVALDNLVDLILTCINHPAAAGEVFLASDGEDLSTTELLQGVAHAMGRPLRLIPVPSGLLMFGATLLGKKAIAQRLLGSLQVDISKARNVLNWRPPVTVEEGLARAVGKQNG
jgi:nucleoside-diphosphate-sugar epimerase